MIDDTENIRRGLVAQNSAAVQSDDISAERTRLQGIHGATNVWDTQQLQQAFRVERFMAPFAKVVRKIDGAEGFVEFQHAPRLYFNFRSV